MGLRRFLCRTVDLRDRARFEGNALDQREVERAMQVREYRHALAKNYRVDQQMVFVDQAGADQTASETSATMSKERFAGALLESLDLSREFARADSRVQPRLPHFRGWLCALVARVRGARAFEPHRGKLLVGRAQAMTREHSFRDLVHGWRGFVLRGRPPRCHVLIRLAPHQMQTRVPMRVDLPLHRVVAHCPKNPVRLPFGPTDKSVNAHRHLKYEFLHCEFLWF
jgi:hypothetical protein